MARVVVVGSGTVVPEADRGSSCYFVELAETRALLDCGPGAVQSLARLGLPWASLTDLVISHFHADHIGALPGLFFAFKHGVSPPRTAPRLDVWGPVGTAELFARLERAFGPFMQDPGFRVEIHELFPDDRVTMRSGVRLAVHPTPHTDESLAVRLEAGHAIVGYTGDTGESASLGPFMQAADLLICECSLRDEEVGPNHLSPSRVARIAGAARPGRLVLTHVYPHLRGAGSVVSLVREAGYDEGEVVLAEDGLVLELGEGARR